MENSLSPNARPTVRKLREIMFKVASRRVRAGRFLDLGAGMGIVGLEALSRGAMIGTFVERSARMCSFIRKNAGSLGIKDGHGEILECEILPFLKTAAKRKRCWDLVYFGTRSGIDDEDAFRLFGRGVPIAAGGLLLIEHSSDCEYPERIGVLSRWRTIANDNSTITFYERK
jgi:16S rRNA (guanine(966)-N(2))-methyltransferase RsmD